MTESPSPRPESGPATDQPAAGESEGSAASAAKAESSVGGSGGDPPQQPPEVRRKGGAIAWIALLIALGAAGATGYWYWQQSIAELGEDPRFEQAQSQLDALQSRLDDLAAELDRALSASAEPSESVLSIRGEVESLRETLNRLSADGDAIRERLANLATRLESSQGDREDALGGLRARMQTLEQSVGERLERFGMRMERLDGQLDGAAAERGVRLALTEIDSLLRFAGNRLALASDHEAAVDAWRRALAMIESLPQGRYSELRDLASDELTRLERYRPFNPGTEVQRLFAISAEVSEWPRADGVAGGDERRSPTSTADAPDRSESSGWRDGLASAFDRLVQVEKVESAGLTTIERERAGARVRMTLQSAALALARSNHELVEVLIAEAAGTIRAVFDTEDPAVSAALAWLEAFEPAQRPAPPELNDTRALIARLLGGAT